MEWDHVDISLMFILLILLYISSSENAKDLMWWMTEWNQRIRLEILKEVKIKCAQSYLYRTKGQMDPYSNYIY